MSGVKKNVVSAVLRLSKDGELRTEHGNRFHAAGPATTNARPPNFVPNDIATAACLKTLVYQISNLVTLSLPYLTSPHLTLPLGRAAFMAAQC